MSGFLCASYNIHYGIGLDGRYDVARIADAVAAADIVCLQEVIQGWPPTGHADQAAEIAGRLSRYYVFGTGVDVDGSSCDAAGRITNRRQTFGNAVLSRWPIRSTRTLLLPKPALPDTFDLQRSVTEAVIDAPGLSFRVYSVHLSHVSAGQRRPQIEALMAWINAAPAEGRPWDHEHEIMRGMGVENVEMPRAAMLMGDLNLTPAEPNYALLCGEIADRAGRQARHDQLRDAWVVAGNDEAVGVSFADTKDAAHRIDHCLITRDLAPLVRRAWIDQTARGSDHYPLFVEFAAAG